MTWLPSKNQFQSILFPMNVPFLDLSAQHQPQRGEFIRAIEAVIDSNAFAGGPFVEEFEQEFASYCQSDHCVGVGSGTDALWLALRAFDIGPGDEVITVPNSFFATAEAISVTGARPVFVDVDEKTYNMDPSLLERAITPRTAAIIPVHLFGQPADMTPILEVARRHGIRVIEDAAQAHGAEYGGRRIGSLADAACFSFYPGKNLGAFGEGGAVVTNDPDTRDKLRMYRDHGQVEKYFHRYVGWNGRMDGIQAAVLKIKLRDLDEFNQLRRSHAERYDKAFAANERIRIPWRAENVRHVYHLYVIQISNRDAVLKRLADRGISCGIHYPVPIHLQEAYQGLGYQRGDFPVSEEASERFLSLPMFPHLTPEQIDMVVAGVREEVGEEGTDQEELARSVNCYENV